MINNEPEVTSTLRTESTVTHGGVAYTTTHHGARSKTPLETCSRCGGSGQLYTRKCKNCDGRGLLRESLRGV
jgi:DnaJ-class molecular chaperone